MYLMDMETSEQLEVPVTTVDDEQLKWIASMDGMEVTLRKFQGEPLTVKLPERVSLKVTEAPKSTKSGKSGDTFKMARLESGRRVKVPHFIEPGDCVVINTVDGSYHSRDKS